MLYMYIILILFIDFKKEKLNMLICADIKWIFLT